MPTVTAEYNINGRILFSGSLKGLKTRGQQVAHPTTAHCSLLTAHCSLLTAHCPATFICSTKIEPTLWDE
ncbi:MAG: hypothetical protein J5680_07840, partial [Neisseriaceae bacterium]|nr:hypothetical protein [Neisseriaceae bacterium]